MGGSGGGGYVSQWGQAVCSQRQWLGLNLSAYGAAASFNRVGAISGEVISAFRFSAWSAALREGSSGQVAAACFIMQTGSGNGLHPLRWAMWLAHARACPSLPKGLPR